MWEYMPANTANTESNAPTKADVIRALRMSPTREQIVMYEAGRASELYQKIKSFGTKRITILVIK
jgi:hypothetical protein